MTNNVLMAVLALVFSGATYAANFAELQKIEGETQSVTLKGKLATVTRSALTKDDQDIAERCGETYTVLLLEKPIQVRLTNLESGEDYEAVVQYLRTWGNPAVKKLNGEFVEVTGVVAEEVLGLCSPGLAIHSASLFPNAQ